MARPRMPSAHDRPLKWVFVFALIGGSSLRADVILDVDFQPPHGSDPLAPLEQVGTPGREEAAWSLQISSEGGEEITQACNIGGTGLAASFSPIPVEHTTRARFDLTHPNATSSSLAPMNVNLFFNDAGPAVDVAIISNSGQRRTIHLLEAIQAETGRLLVGIQFNGYVNAADRPNSVTCVDNIQLQAVPEPSGWIALSLVVGLLVSIISKQPIVVCGVKDDSIGGEML